MIKPRFHTLRVKELREETGDCRSILFDLPVELEERFRFVPGQYLTLRADIDGEDIRRSYSLCSSPLERELRVAVKQIEGGKFSTFANQALSEGDTLDVMPPMGNFHTPLSPDQRKSYLAIAAGSGITPILSIIKTALRTEPESEFTLFYGNRNAASIIFKEQIEGLKNQFLDRFQVYYFLSREMRDIPLFNGRLDAEKINHALEHLVDVGNVDDCFICGPEDMIMSAKAALENRGMDEKRIHFELFTSPGAKKGGGKKRETQKRNGKVSLVTVKDSGSSYRFELSQGTNNILDAALLNGADLPFACKGGVCCTCKAKVTRGKVEMEVNYALEPEEVEQGFVLSCQAFPLTDEVEIDFDQAM